MTLIFQYYSDLHLESRKKNPKCFPNGNGGLQSDTNNNNKYVCVLAGDIGNPREDTYWKFISQVSSAFDYVIIVLGNHEYYGSNYAKTIDFVKLNIKSKNCTNTFLLENNCCFIENCVILGTTLWSDIPSHAEHDILMGMNDYKYIEYFSIEFQNNLHKKAINFISETFSFIKKHYPHLKIIVVTHHAPLLKVTSSPNFKESKSTYAFGTDLPDLINLCDTWIYGHTHYNINTLHPKLKTNQLGYLDSPMNGFDSNASFSI